MKKSALFLLTLFYSFTLLLSSAIPSFAQTPAPTPDPCAVLPPGMSLETCQAISKLFETQQDGPWYNQNPSQFAKKVTDPTNASDIFGERYTFAQINWIINSIATMINPGSGIDSPTKLWDFLNAIQKILKEIGSNQQPSLAEYAKLGPSGLFVGGISVLYSNPPASGIGEIKTLAFKIFDLGTGVKPAYAQGYGFNGLNTGGAVRTLWTASRNMAYLIMIILLIASGFLIMFRVKINPQTVVSLQTMIPKLIVTLLLVTFSFAIAGLVIDLVYVVIAAFVGMLGLGGNIITNDVPGVIDSVANKSFPFYLWLQIPITLIMVIVLPIFIIGATALATFFTLGTATLPVGGALIITAILVILPALWAIIILGKIFIMLIKAYVMLILQICIGPLQIMLDLIPGQHGFGPWLRNLIANASVFATVPIMLLIQHILSGNFITNSILHLNTFSGLGGTNLNLPFMGSKLNQTDFIITWIVGYTIFSLTPKIADMVRDALKIPPFKYGSAIGEPIQPYTKTAGGAIISFGKETVKGPIGGAITAVGEQISSFRTQ